MRHFNPGRRRPKDFLTGDFSDLSVDAGYAASAEGFGHEQYSASGTCVAYLSNDYPD
jgi:hypothetical protein